MKSFKLSPTGYLKENGFRHARPFGGSVGREQWHVHFEDAKGIIWYYAGNTDKGVKLERGYEKAMKFTAAKASALAKRLNRLYKNVRHDGGHFYSHSASDMSPKGVKENGRIKLLVVYGDTLATPIDVADADTKEHIKLMRDDDDDNDEKDIMLVGHDSSGDVITGRWPLRNKEEIQNLSELLFDARETGQIPSDTESVILPDNSEFFIDTGRIVKKNGAKSCGVKKNGSKGRYKVEHKYAGGWADAEWSEDSAPETFASVAEAKAAIAEHIADAREAGLDDYRASDYRVVPVSMTEAYAMASGGLKKKVTRRS